MLALLELLAMALSLTRDGSAHIGITVGGQVPTSMMLHGPMLILMVNMVPNHGALLCQEFPEMPNGSGQVKISTVMDIILFGAGYT